MTDAAQSESVTADNVVTMTPSDSSRPPDDTGTTPPPPPPPKTAAEDAIDLKTLLLGNWISAVVVVGCLLMAAVMVVQLYFQLSDLNSPPATTTLETLKSPSYLSMDVANREQVGMFALENDAQFLRTRRAQSLVAARLYVQSISVLAGIALIVMGSSFVFARIKTDQPTNFVGENKETKLTLDTYSPGLVLAGFGSILIAIAVLVSPNQIARTQDGAVFLPLYLGASSQNAVEAPKTITPQEEADLKAIFEQRLEQGN